MNNQLIFRTEAENDLADIEAYYDAISPLLSKRFFTEFLKPCNLLNRNHNYSRLGTEK